MKSRFPLRLAIALAGACTQSMLFSTRAGTLDVTTLEDNGPGSLRQTISDATPGDNIVFGVSGTIMLTHGDLVISKNLTITGPGAELLALSGNLSSRVLLVNTNATVAITGLVLRDGRTANGTAGADGQPGGASAPGGGIYNAGTLTLNNCVLSNNTTGNGGVGGHAASGGHAGAGGAIFNEGQLVLNQCNVLSNFTGNGGMGGSVLEGENGNPGGNGGDAGAIYSSGSLQLTNCALSGNFCGNGGNGSAGYSYYGWPPVSGSGRDGGRGGDGGHGGAIYNSGNSALHGQLLNNRAGQGGTGGSGGGGGYYVGNGGRGGAGGNGGDGGGVFNKGMMSCRSTTLAACNGGRGGQGGDGGSVSPSAPQYSPGSGGYGGYGGSGGAIRSEAAATIVSSTLSGNSAGNAALGGLSGMGFYPQYRAFPGSGGDGGGFHGQGALTNCTLSENVAGQGYGGGHGGGCAGSLTLFNCAVVSNSTGGPLPEYGIVLNADGGGVAAAALLANTIIALNSDYFGSGDGNHYPDVAGVFSSLGHNLIGVVNGGSGFTNTDLAGSVAAPLNPQLGPLMDNGGPTLTHAPLLGSPVINAGENSGLSETDQRGLPRVLCAIVDIGAVETEMCHEILSLSLLNNEGCHLRCAGLAGTNYRLQASADLVLWTNLACLPAGTNGLFDFTDQQATNLSRGFYRLSWP